MTSPENNLHIITSVKGGVGKTLLSLSVLCSYLNNSVRDRNLLCVDTNTTNIDFYRLLAGRTNGRPVAGTRWRCSPIDTSHHFVAKRTVPYSLFRGTHGFWEELTQIINSDKFANYDAVVDTNLHISNILDVDQATDQILWELCSRTRNRRIYFWIVWNFASLADDEYVQNGVARIRSLPPDVLDRISVVHVLNPSAVTAPENSIQSEIQALVRIQHRKEQLDRLIVEFEQESRLQERDVLKQVRDKYLSEELVGLKMEDVDLDSPRPFPGLRDLNRNETVVEDIDYEEFVSRIGQTITNYPDAALANVFDHIYQTEFQGRGRPRNLLVISTHDPGLRGYTEYLSQIGLESLCGRIVNVQLDVETFLRELDMV